jgi:hypothetical protein
MVARGTSSFRDALESEPWRPPGTTYKSAFPTEFEALFAALAQNIYYPFRTKPYPKRLSSPTPTLACNTVGLGGHVSALPDSRQQQAWQRRKQFSVGRLFAAIHTLRAVVQVSATRATQLFYHIEQRRWEGMMRLACNSCCRRSSRFGAGLHATRNPQQDTCR